MKELEVYFQDNFISASRTDKNRVWQIDGETYYLVQQKEVMISDQWEIVCYPNEIPILENCDHYIFKFGGKYYFSENKFHPELKPLLYLGANEHAQMPGFPYLGIHGRNEIMNGTRNYSDWCKRAIFLGYKTLGICELNTLAGAYDFYSSCKESNIHPVIGMTIETGTRASNYRVKLYVKHEIGWKNILKINKSINIEGNKIVSFETIAKYSEGLICVLGTDSPLRVISQFKKVFTDDLYFQFDVTKYDNKSYDEKVIKNIGKYLKKYIEEVPPVLICDAYYLEKEHAYAKHKLNEVNKSFTEHKSDDQYMKAFPEIYEHINDLFNSQDIAFSIIDYMLSGTKQLAEKCFFEFNSEPKLPKYKLSEKDYELLKIEPVRVYTDKDGNKVKEYPDKYYTSDLIWYLIQEGLEEKVIKKGKDVNVYLERLAYEYEVISKANLIDYFLIVWDKIRHAKESEIGVGLGRGSAAGALISYLIGVVGVDPLEYNLIFERFLNEGRLYKEVEKEYIIIDTEEGEKEFESNQLLKVNRENKEIYIPARNILPNDLLII